MFVTLDFETFWDSRTYTLSKTGPVEYVRDPRFTVQLAALVEGLEGDPSALKARVWSGDEPSGEALRAVAASSEPVVWIGHNLSGFDAIILSEHYGIRPTHMWDTISMMNWTGLSRIIGRSHAALTEKLGTGRKDTGTVVSNGKRWPDDFTEHERDFFVRYCAADAKQCAANAARMLPYMTADALHFMSITARMATDPVFELEEGLIEKYIAKIDASVAKARQDIMSVFRFPDEEAFLQAVRSAPRFAAMLVSLGVEPPMKVSDAKTKTKKAQLDYLLANAKDADEVEQVRYRMDRELPVKTYAFSKQDLDFLALREHEDPRVQLLVEARLEHNSSINRSRAERFLVFARHHKPVPIMLSAFNAHTSRYTAGAAEEGASSDRLQFQNLSKRDPNKAMLRVAIHAPLRHKVVACDSSQVEARCLAWVAGETELVQQFAQGRDPYSELASTIFGVPHEDIHAGAKSGDKKMKTYRNVGKTCILSAGYGVGASKFSDTLVRQGARLSDDLVKHKELAFHAHAVYRASNPNIVNFWAQCQRVVEALAAGYSGEFGGPDGKLFKYGPMTICGVETVPSVMLPSGFIIRYPNLRCMSIDGKNNYVYDRPKVSYPIKVYGGSMTENLIQGFAFQILMWQACRMDEAGINIKCNIHDSFATVVPTEQAEATAQKMLSIMKTTPPWAQGLPIDAEAEIGEDFGVV